MGNSCQPLAYDNLTTPLLDHSTAHVSTLRGSRVCRAGAATRKEHFVSMEISCIPNMGETTPSPKVCPIGRCIGARSDKRQPSLTGLLPHDSHTHSNFLKSQLFSFPVWNTPASTPLNCRMLRRAGGPQVRPIARNISAVMPIRTRLWGRMRGRFRGTDTIGPDPEAEGEANIAC